MIGEGKYGKLEVTAVDSLKMGAVRYCPTGADHLSLLLAMHANVYSCEELLRRTLKAWEDPAARLNRAMAQFDFIIRCGGLGIAREAFACVLRGEAANAARKE